MRYGCTNLVHHRLAICALAQQFGIGVGLRLQCHRLSLSQLLECGSLLRSNHSVHLLLVCRLFSKFEHFLDGRLDFVEDCGKDCFGIDLLKLIISSERNELFDNGTNKLSVWPELLLNLILLTEILFNPLFNIENVNVVLGLLDLFV